VDRVQVEILGLSTSPASGGAYALILKESAGKRRLPIIIGAFEAQSIALEIEGIKPPRPLTHDLLKNIIDALGFSITEVVISELREGTFYARLLMDSGAAREIDSRPSDAIALAVRYGAPIFVADEVMNEAGFVPDGEEEEENAEAASPGPEAEEGESRRETLQAKLEEAIQQEDYERAAQLRDEIRRLESEG
jgi:hypothetical protein